MDPTERFEHAVAEGRNILLTGPGGTGKTFAINRLLEQRPDIARTASTGLAARHLNGQTLHRYSGGLKGPAKDQSFREFYDYVEGAMPGVVVRARRNVTRTRTIVIDEVSMLSGRFLGYVDWAFKKYRESTKPFGGLQVICVGDFLQLPPVCINEPTDWAFHSEAWKAADFEVIQLEKIWRQEDIVFVGLLQAIRQGRRLSRDQVDMLAGRIIPFPPLRITRLFPTNNLVSKWNEILLAQTPGPVTTCQAITTGDPDKIEKLARDILAPAELRLKVGAYVLLVVNDRDGRYVNGSTGFVTAVHRDYVTIDIDGNDILVGRFTWSEDDRKVTGFGSGPGTTFTQFPLRLGYALTIHKAQGMSLENGYVDVGSASLQPAMTYVALSRLRSPDGLFLRSAFNSYSTARAALRFYGYAS